MEKTGGVHCYAVNAVKSASPCLEPQAKASTSRNLSNLNIAPSFALGFYKLRNPRDQERYINHNKSKG